MVVEVELFEQVLDVNLDRAFGNIQLARNEFVGEAASKLLQNFTFTLR